MGFSVKFNWVLQIQPEKTLNIGECYEFKKAGNRVFPLDTPIDLIDLERSAIAKIKVVSFTNIHDSTLGEFKVVKVYDGTEKDVLTRYWIENQNE